MIFASLAALMFPLAVSHQQPAWEDASQMPPVVKRALYTQDHWRFTGKRIVSFRKGPDTLKHAEYLTRDGNRLRIEFPGESKFSGQVIVDDGDERRHFFPKTDVIHVTPSHREPLFEHLHGDWKGNTSIRVTEESGDKVAGIWTRLVKVIDGSGNRLQELNIDPKSGVVLSRRIYDDVGTQVGSFEFSQINLHPDIDPSIFKFSRVGATITTPVDDLKKLCRESSFVFKSIPESTGLVLDSARVRDISGQHLLMCQYLSKRGRVILFQMAPGVDTKELVRHGPPNVHAVFFNSDGHWFVLVGSMRESQLKSIAAEIR